MEQQRALNALEPFIALSKSATSPRAAADLIKQATSHSQTYVFAELLQTPNIQALRNSSEHSSHLKLLEIFAWGTWADYEASKSHLPPLTPQQTQKLRLLSLLPLLSTPQQPASPSTQPPQSQPESQLSYAYLSRALSLPKTRALEALLTTALSSSLITGHLDPLHQLVAVTSVAPLRDLPPNSVPRMVDVLEDWEGRCQSTLKEIEARVQNVRDNARKRGEVERKRKKAFEAEVDKDGGSNAENQGGHNARNSGLRSGNAYNGGMGGSGANGSKRSAPLGDWDRRASGGDAMDIDESYGDGGSRSRPGSGGTGERGTKKPSRGGR